MAYMRVPCLFMAVNKALQNTRQKGDKGEDIACFYLEKHGFFIQERNHLRKWGEIDIIAVKDSILHFIEVKSVTQTSQGYRPEENVHALKQKKLRRVIQTFLNEGKYGPDAKFKFHVITVTYTGAGKSKVMMLSDIIL
jgi:putative endonuclease